MAILRVVRRLNDVTLVVFILLILASPVVRQRLEVAVGAPLYVLFFRGVLRLYLSDWLWAWGRGGRSLLILIALYAGPSALTSLVFGYVIAVTDGIRSPFVPVFVVAMVFPVSLFPDWRGWIIVLLEELAMMAACLWTDPSLSFQDLLFLIMLFGVPAAVMPLARDECRHRILSAVDTLSGLMVRRRFEELVERRLAQRTAREGGVGLAMVDVDHFKAVNDAGGHLRGDEVLRAIGQIARRCLEPGDLMGRMGGDEFAILLFRRTRRQAEAALEHIRRQVATLRLDPAGGREGHAPVRITISMGLAWSTGKHVQLLDLLAAADAALYRAKERGRNRLEVTPYGASPWAGRVA